MMNNREWIAISLVVGFILFVGITANSSHVHAKNILNKHSLPKTLVISLSGAVQNPGQYECMPGTTLKDLLKKAGIKSSANRRKIPFKKVLLSNQTIEIPEKKVISSRNKKISLEENEQFCYDLSS